MSDTKRIATRAAAATTAIGAALLVYMIAVESEPGLLPLVLVFGGLAAWVVARRRRRGDG